MGSPWRKIYREMDILYNGKRYFSIKNVVIPTEKILPIMYSKVMKTGN